MAKRKVWPIDRIVRYGERYWHRARHERWPTVREVARALRMKQSDVLDCAGDQCRDRSSVMLTGYNWQDVRAGDLMVEIQSPRVDAWWDEYWSDAGLAVARSPIPAICDQVNALYLKKFGEPCHV